MQNPFEPQLLYDLLNRADTLQQGGRIAEACDLLAKAIKFSPDDSRLYHAMTRILLAEERYQDALDAIEGWPSIAFDQTCAG